eukprot:79827_1
MEKLIQFHELLDSLSPDEYQELLNDILKENRDLFTTLLFYHFQNQDSITSTSQLDINAINAKAVEIINSRQANNSFIERGKGCNIGNTFTFERLSDDLLAKISSNLSLPDYINFEKCSRRIFVVLRTTPMAMSSVSLTTCDMKKYYEFLQQNPSNKYGNRFKAITNIHLNFENHHDYDTIKLLKMFNSIVRWESVESLDIFAMDISVQKIAEIIQKCANIKYLQLYMDDINNVNWTDPLYKLQPMKTLKGLKIYPCDVSLIDVVSKQLESLHVEYPIWQISKIFSFNNLKEVCVIVEPGMLDRLIAIANSSKMLERINVSFDGGSILDLKNDDVKNVLSLSSIRYLCMVGYLNESECLRVINALIYALSEKQRPIMKIRLRPFNVSAKNFVSNNDEELYQSIIKLINIANQNIDDFMFILDFECDLIKTITQFKNWCQKFSNQMNNLFSISLYHNYLYDTACYEPAIQLIISNKKHSIHAHKEKWTYHCRYCEECMF